MNKNVFLVVFLSLMLVGCTRAGGTEAQKSLHQGKLLLFSEAIGFEQEEIESVVFEYKGYPSVIPIQTALQFTDMLYNAEPVAVADDHIYQPSDYLVRFVGETEEVTVVFYWFTFRRNTETSVYDDVSVETNNISDTHDSRFDVLIGDTLYHYMICGNAIWNDELSRSTFNKGDTQKKTYEIDGFASEIPNPGYAVLEDTSLEEIIDRSELIVLAKAHQTIYLNSVDSIVWFTVEDCLKGNKRLPFVIRRTSEENRGMDAIRYPLPVDPHFEQGETYLLCLRESGLMTSVDIDLLSFKLLMPIHLNVWELPSPYYSAVLYDGVLYPRFNTENHPFLHISLEEIKQLMK